MTHNKDKVPCCRRQERCERKSYIIEPTNEEKGHLLG
jgi:hypothetical protein